MHTDWIGERILLLLLLLLLSYHEARGDEILKICMYMSTQEVEGETNMKVLMSKNSTVEGEAFVWDTAKGTSK